MVSHQTGSRKCNKNEKHNCLWLREAALLPLNAVARLMSPSIEALPPTGGRTSDGTTHVGRIQQRRNASVCVAAVITRL